MNLKKMLRVGPTTYRSQMLKIAMKSVDVDSCVSLSYTHKTTIRKIM